MVAAKMKINHNEDWLREKAAIEDSSVCSAGGTLPPKPPKSFDSLTKDHEALMRQLELWRAGVLRRPSLPWGLWDEIKDTIRHWRFRRWLKKVRRLVETCDQAALDRFLAKEAKNLDLAKPPAEPRREPRRDGFKGFKGFKA